MASNDISDSDVITRFAIDSAGHLGSFYDGYRDSMLGQLDVTSITKSSDLVKSRKCQIIRGDKSKKLNNLQLIGIEDELILSILLNLTPKTGITALMEYIHSLSEFTRILYFNYMSSEQQLRDSLTDSERLNQSMMPQTSATHIVTGITWGINLIIILQLPSDDETVKKIDDALEKTRNALENGADNLTLDTEEEKVFEAIIDTKAFSNVPELTGMTTLCDICRRIDQFKNGIINYPVKYTLRPIRWLFPENPEHDATFVDLPSGFISYIQKHIFQISSRFKDLEISFNSNLPNSLSNCLKGKLYDAQEQWFDTKKKYMDEIDRLSKLLINYRHGGIAVLEVKKALHDENQFPLEKAIKDLTENLKDLEKKGKLINDIQPFKYCNVAERDIDENDTEETIQRKLIIDEQHDRVLCTNDVLNNTSAEQLNELRCKLETEHEENPSLRLIYADFSYSSYKLCNMMILSSLSNKNIDEPNQPIQENTPILTTIQHTEIINILLLGETGVGKSTFVNALANYLTFDSLQTAESNKPVILIPVSFLMTAGDNFKEYTVKFDHTHESSSENFSSFGQSVTQHCNSYILNLKNNPGKKLRIIDTPGFGDTKGSEQDDYNMQHILEYTNRLTHLNAICFLLKPNITRLNILFRSCIHQLIEHLGPDAGRSIIFCFTNARSTFFSPGNTAPLLKAMLKSLPMNNILFQKDNTFCFDSESFRYLVACQKNVPFNDLNKSEYERSWSMSTQESDRLFDYICKCLPVQCEQNERQSIQHVQFKILHMIRPMLETIRNTLRNIILFTSNLSKQSIELHAKNICYFTTRCLSCKPTPIQVANFWILPDPENKIQNKCSTCPCTSNQHIPVEYLLEYKCSRNTPDFNKMQNMLQSILDASVGFAHFLLSTSHSTKDDPFLIVFNRMAEEEKHICTKVQPNEFNSDLVNQLERLLCDYAERMANIKNTEWSNKMLTGINDQIKIVVEYPMISEQMRAIQQGQEMMMKQHEHIC